ncbi:hypothetical protein TNCV_4983721 [Trichonephila clavipes]|nr:hypothetical protein TNCV_4983721 [Trichonephila clavipes]
MARSSKKVRHPCPIRYLVSAIQKGAGICETLGRTNLAVYHLPYISISGWSGNLVGHLIDFLITSGLEIDQELLVIVSSLSIVRCQSAGSHVDPLRLYSRRLLQSKKYRSKRPLSSGPACSDDQKANLLAITLKDNFTENERPNGDYPIDNMITNTLENFFSHPPTPSHYPDEVLNCIKTLSNNKAPADWNIFTSAIASFEKNREIIIENVDVK